MINKCSLQYAIDNNFFEYPLYHGTTSKCRLSIEQNGFQIFVGAERSGCVQNGYLNSSYYNGIPPPIHHLGFGIYFTTVKSIAKQFNEGSTRGLVEYRIATRHIDVINFGAHSTMMNWWIKHGYDPELAKVDRVAATQQLTDTISERYDAVWFRGKGLSKLLDGDQVCVYRPEVVFKIDNNMARPGDIGSKVIRKSDGMIGIYQGFREFTQEQSSLYHHGERGFMEVKWKKGKSDPNVYPSTIEFLQ